MLYTVLPMEQIYKKKEKNSVHEVERKKVPLSYGEVTLENKGEGYVVKEMFSTDMADYLNKKYFPGTLFEEKGMDTMWL